MKQVSGQILIVCFALIGFYKGYEKEVYLLLGISICLFFFLYVLSTYLDDISKKLDELIKEIKK